MIAAKLLRKASCYIDIACSARNLAWRTAVGRDSLSFSEDDTYDNLTGGVSIKIGMMDAQIYCRHFFRVQ